MRFEYVAALLPLVLAGCSWTPPPPSVPQRSPVGGSGSRPLVVDWGSSDRTLLNSSRARGPLVFAVQDGKLEPLFDCHVNGRYRYTPETTVQVQDDIIDSQNQLRVKLPFAGASFSSDLQTAGKLHVRMKVAGTFAADRTTFERNDLDGKCDGATHVATYVTVGAFKLFTLSSTNIEGGVEVPGGAGGGGAHQASEKSLNEAGDEAACSKATSHDTTPPENCATSLQLVLGPIVASDDVVPPQEQRRSVPALVIASAGLLLAGAATIAYVVNDGNYRELRDKCSGPSGCSTASYDDKASSIQTWDRLSAGGWVIGGAMWLGGGIWWLSSGIAQPTPPPRSNAGLLGGTF